MTEKYKFVVFKVAEEDTSAEPYRDGTGLVIGVPMPRPVIRFYLTSVHGLVRGLYDWSDGREILGRLNDCQVLDVFVAELTFEEAEAIREGKKEPPGYVKRMKDAGLGHMI